MSVGEYLKELRQVKGISQKELSALTNGEVSNAEISRLEAGIRKKPSPAILKLVAPHLGVPVSDLLTRAGYMDQRTDNSDTADEIHPADGVDLTESPVAQTQYPPRTKAMDEEGLALRTANQELRDETDALRQTIQKMEADVRQWEDKYHLAVAQGGQGAESENAASAGEIRSLRDSNAKLKEENRRIMEETMAFLEEGTSLRTEAENYRKKMTLAEDAARKAKITQEALEEETRNLKDELQALRDKGVMFAFESNEEQEKEFSRLKEELLHTINQKNDLLEEKERVAGRLQILETKLNEAEQSGKVVVIEAAPTAPDESLTETLRQDKRNLDKEVAQLKEMLVEAEAKKDELLKEKSEAEAGRAQLTLEKEKAQTERDKLKAEAQAQRDRITAEAEAERALLVGEMSEVKAERDQLVIEKLHLEKQLLASKEAISMSSPMMESIMNTQVGDLDIGEVFIGMMSEGNQEDLTLLGRLMQAMNRDAIKASDKRMLLDILKRFTK